MKKRVLQFNLILWALFACNAPSAENKLIHEPNATVENDLPHLRIKLLDKSEIDARQLEGKVVLVFFQPDCDHCQREASEIAQNLVGFKDASLYFVSSDSPEKVANFAKDYKLNGVERVYFGIASTESVLKNFGPITTPSFYIYSAEGKLVKAFNGEVEISALLKYI